MKRNTKGFTLIELLIVVVIIGILAAIAIPKFAATKERAYVASMKTDLRNLVTAEEGYAGNSGGKYLAPTDSTAVKTLGAQLSTGNKMGGGAAVDASTTSAPGWSATMTSTNTGKQCYIFVGGGTPPKTLTPALTDGAPGCDP
ncbi:MAG: type II secretion system protein [Gemmatimonadaceae bacterium]